MSNEPCKETLGQKLKKFLSVKWWGFVIATAVLTLTSIYGEVTAAFVGGLVSIYGVLVAGNAAGKVIRSSNEQLSLKARVGMLLKGEARPDE